MAKKKYYVALVNFTDKAIQYAESYDDYDEAHERATVSLAAQAILNHFGGSEDETAKGKEWASVGPLDEPFAFPAEST
jgi:hypothetical protein